ncbi:MAG: VWA domain-containing protein [Muribaculaceae bacterium]|nr:VWA domain-containing protein [Muribaculaceae bacterium]
MKVCVTKLLQIVLFLMLSNSIFATNTSFLVDVSSSMNGWSPDRKVKSLAKVNDELRLFLTDNSKDSVQIIKFSDKIWRTYFIAPDRADMDEVLRRISYPEKGNTNLNPAIKAAANSKYNDRIVIISDGLQNVGDESSVISSINTITQSEPKYVYYLLVDESDTNNPLIQQISNADNVKLIRSLSELNDVESSDLNDSKETKSAADIRSDVNGFMNLLNTEDTSKSESDNWNIDWNLLWKILLWILIAALIVAICVLIWKLLPLFLKVGGATAGAIQKAIFVLFNMPKPIFNLIFRMLPSKMNTFLREYMPKYDDFKRGKVKHKNEAERKTLEEIKKQTGKDLKYKNGEPDLESVAEHKEKLDGGIDANIPKGKDPRKNVSIVQDKAANQMLNSESGRKKISDYIRKHTGENPKVVTKEHYYKWKDDTYNQGKPWHNPKTPHESIDGKYVMWVPKKYHDVSWGGIGHNGGVSMLKSIRNYFGLNV